MYHRLRQRTFVGIYLCCACR